MVTRTLIILLALAVSASAQCICPPMLVNRNGLVGRWIVPGKQTGNAALPTTILDDSGNGNHGTTSNAPNYGIIYSRPAMNFNGSSQYVGVKAAPILNNLPQSSISAWVYPTSFAQQNTKSRTVYAEDTSFGTDFGMLINSSGYPFFYIYTGVDNSCTSSTTISLNTWSHIVTTFDTTVGMKIYVNGTLTGTNSNKTVNSGLNLTELGRQFFNGSTGGSFAGSIDDVRVYSRALPAAEIRAIYRGEQ